MFRKNPIIKGAFILTAAGFATRLTGFFYRIFLSRSFGEESVGIYQLVFPVFALCFSLSTAGVETAIARSVAASFSLGRPGRAKSALLAGLSLSLSAAFFLMLFLQKEADYIARTFLGEPRCSSLITVIALALPFCAVHSCICGYYIGLKQTRVPALSQLLEQFARVGTVFLLCTFFAGRTGPPDITVAAAGIAAGETASSLFCLKSILPRLSSPAAEKAGLSFLRDGFCDILPLSIPLTANRVLLNILQSVEAASIPQQLQLYGFSVRDSLSLYGVLTGMALPCILFPSAITNSIASMMLPSVAELAASDDRDKMSRLIRKVFFCCFTLGILCCAALLLLGGCFGRLLFQSSLAGEFIVTLAWICPFLYTNGNLLSILGGLGKTNLSFLFSTVSLLLRIGSVFFLIPMSGIRGYLWGLLSSQIALFSLCLIYLRFYLAKER